MVLGRSGCEWRGMGVGGHRRGVVLGRLVLERCGCICVSGRLGESWRRGLIVLGKQGFLSYIIIKLDMISLSP